MGPFKDIGVEKTGHVPLVEIRRPPHNYFDVALIRELATAFGALDADPGCRALMLAAHGKAFCAPSAAGWAWPAVNGSDERLLGTEQPVAFDIKMRSAGGRSAQQGAPLSRSSSPKLASALSRSNSGPFWASRTAKRGSEDFTFIASGNPHLRFRLRLRRREQRLRFRDLGMREKPSTAGPCHGRRRLGRSLRSTSNRIMHSSDGAKNT